ncbi:hypothetical protein L6164_019951 [Bauhinia variegata]|uniref:Uncharacterized protein n=1 Tax=Bauhinia variegata TaxID=167791 RepID=A0ACB9MY76_BAUVA|nr:hypothetical protein L6164_019951 [Bauhinia variegata]
MDHKHEMERKHYVLVHGACHGAWSWYKLKPLLESAGDQVTVLDQAASGINPKKIDDVNKFSDYSEPLLDFLASLPPNGKVILVGHSLGGLNIALAMDKFPEKVAVGVFLAAFMPDTQNKPSYVIDQYIGRTPAAEWLDTQLSSNGSKTSMLFGPRFLSDKLYQLSPTEDIELARTLIRPSSLFVEDLSKENNFTKEDYGSVPRSYVICEEDLAIPLEYQRWMIQNAGIDHVEVLKGADHMAMLCKPRELHHVLSQIADKYASEHFTHA